MEEAGPVELPIDTEVGRRLRWQVVKQLGKGTYGAVYSVRERASRVRAALKAESNFVADGSVLKLEVQILKRLRGRQCVPKLLDSGQTHRYSYMVMTLCGSSLAELFRECRREFSVSTQLRVGVHILYGLKQLHEVGFVHRDVKPGNMAIGRKGERARMVHLLDFGMARAFVLRHSGRVELRKPRALAKFRGTPLYASFYAHAGVEQGRSDDLWSTMYVLAEMRSPLPWRHLHDLHRIRTSKQTTDDKHLFRRSPPALRKMAAHLRTLDYSKRPDYALLFDLLLEAMLENNVKYSDPFDWELRGVHTTAGKSKAAVITACKKIGGRKTPKQHPRKEAGEDAPATDDLPLFFAADLAKNELGF